MEPLVSKVARTSKYQINKGSRMNKSVNEILDSPTIYPTTNIGYKAMKKRNNFYYSCHMNINGMGILPYKQESIYKFEKRNNIHCENSIKDLKLWHIFLELDAAKYWTEINPELVIAKVNFLSIGCIEASWVQYKDKNKFKCVGTTTMHILGEIIPLERWNKNLEKLKDELVKEYVNKYEASMRLGISSQRKCKELRLFDSKLFTETVNKCRELNIIHQNDKYITDDNSAYIVAVANRLSLLES